MYELKVVRERPVDFSRLMGGYIAVFFVVSQVIAVVAMGERLAPNTLLGGALIVAGGFVVQFGAGLH